MIIGMVSHHAVRVFLLAGGGRRRAAARKCPMLVMHDPTKTSSILVPDTSDSNLASSGSFGAQRIGSVTSSRLIS